MPRKAKSIAEIESLARSYTHTAIKTLAGIMMEPSAPPRARVAAAAILLDRGWGKPKQHIEGQATHRYVVELPPVLSKLEWQQKYGATSEPSQALVVPTGLRLSQLVEPPGGPHPS
jgi:hypothetical protein